MSEPYRKPYRPWDRQRDRHAAHRPDAKLSAGDRVFCVLETVPTLDWRRFSPP